jgi:hypothetical protein
MSAGVYTAYETTKAFVDFGIACVPTTGDEASRKHGAAGDSPGRTCY